MVLSVKFGEFNYSILQLLTNDFDKHFRRFLCHVVGEDKQKQNRAFSEFRHSFSYEFY